MVKKFKKKKENKEDLLKLKCPHCNNGRLKFKGSIGCVGFLRWKCKNCGRTVWKREVVKAPKPLVYIPYFLQGVK